MHSPVPCRPGRKRTLWAIHFLPPNFANYGDNPPDLLKQDIQPPFQRTIKLRGLEHA